MIKIVRHSPIVLLFLITTTLIGCYGIRGSNGGGEIKLPASRTINPSDIALPGGYQIEAVATELTFLSALAFDGQGQLYALESGYSYGEVFKEPRLLRIGPDKQTTVVAKGSKNGPWNGVTYHEGAFYVSEGGVLEGGKILKITPDGTITTLVEGLPSFGDHHTNGPVVRDGYVYFGQGTATNSGVVGNDNHDFGWLKRKPDFHDIPCKDITLNGRNYTSDNIVTDARNDKATTGAYLPYNTAATNNQVIQGQLPCSGAIMRVPVGGGPVELVAWGLRNPYGMAWSPEGKLYVTENAFDVRGSRPVWGTGDVLWEIQEGQWYGWPDYAEGRAVWERKSFKVPGKGKPQPVMASYPNQPPKPAAIMGIHSSSNGFDFSRNASFGHEGEAFVAQFGDMAPQVGKVLSPVGYKIVKVNVRTGVIEDFAVNKGKKNGPASWLKKGGLERPMAVKFDPAGTAMYVADFGIMQVTKKGSKPVEGTSVVWKITRQTR
jgi:glucose/arabinose dehydrogenase